MRVEEPLGTLSYKTSFKRSQLFWYLIVPENLCVFLSNKSEVYFRVFSCVLTRICTGSSVARLVCLGRATTTYDAQSNRSLLHCVLRLKLFTSSKASSHGPNKQGEQLSFLYISVLKHTKGL